MTRRGRFLAYAGITLLTAILAGCAESGAGDASPRFLSVSVGEAHVCAVDTGGEVWCWGRNRYGELGTGDVTGRNTPTRVEGFDAPVREVAAGRNHSCASTETGDLFCWGGNFTGKLGTGDLDAVNTPTRVPFAFPGGVTQIRLGNDRSCVLDGKAQAWCWGRNADGSISESEQELQMEPLQVTDNEVRELLLTATQICFLADDLRCRGVDGKLFAETGRKESVFATIDKMPGSASGVANGGLKSCVTADGDVWCWGFAPNPLSPSGRQWLEPTRTEVGSARKIAMSEGSTCALTEYGRVLCWGRRDISRTATSIDGPSSPTEIPGLPGPVRDINGGPTNICVVTEDGEIRCWGANDDGQLGNGSAASSIEPVAPRFG